MEKINLDMRSMKSVRVDSDLTQENQTPIFKSRLPSSKTHNKSPVNDLSNNAHTAYKNFESPK